MKKDYPVLDPDMKSIYRSQTNIKTAMAMYQDKLKKAIGMNMIISIRKRYGTIY